jgi:competence protein ComEA
MLKRILAIVAMLYASMAFAAVDVNKATAAELDGIKGIGPAISTKIIDERKKGNFKDWNDFIERVKGVGEGNAAKFSTEGLTVNGAGFKGAAAAPAAPAAKAEAKPAAAAAPAAAPAAKEEKKDPKADAKMKADEAKKAKAEEKAKKAEEAKAKKDAAKQAKEDAKKAKAEKAAAAPQAPASAPKK